MNTAVSSTKKTKSCKSCKNKFTPIRSTGLYCSVSCRSSYHDRKKARATAKKVDRRKAKIPSNSFFQWIAAECKRAGSVEILTNTDLSELYNLRRKTVLASGVVDGKPMRFPANPEAVELSHICPASHEQLVGLLHPRNMVLAPAIYNRRRGSNYSGGGMWLLRGALQPQWLVTDGMTSGDILELVQRFLGASLNEFLELHNITINHRSKLIKKLSEITSYPESNFEYWKTSEIEYALSDYDELPSNAHNLKAWSVQELMFHEVKRFHSYGMYSGSMSKLINYVETTDRLQHSFLIPSTLSIHLSGEPWQSFLDVLSTKLWPILHCDGNDLSGLSESFFECIAMNVKTSDEHWQPSTPLERTVLLTKGRDSCISVVSAADLELPF